MCTCTCMYELRFRSQSFKILLLELLEIFQKISGFEEDQLERECTTDQFQM